MAETIRDTFVDLNVDVLTAMLTLMERTIATRFTAVDVALAQLASPPHRAGPHSPAPPNVTAPPDAATDLPGSTRPTGDKDASPNRFQATTTFSPGSSFPAGNRVSHMREADNPNEDLEHGTWRTQDPADTGAPITSRPGSALPATGLSHFRDGRPSQAPTQQHPWGDDNMGTSPNQYHHNCVTGRRDMRPNMHSDHRWSFEDREDDGDKGGYVMMGGQSNNPAMLSIFDRLDSGV